eukprot:1068291-Ditylum_brightwellii.AAC.1
MSGDLDTNEQTNICINKGGGLYIEYAMESREGVLMQTVQESVQCDKATTKTSTDNDTETATKTDVAKEIKEEKGDDDAAAEDIKQRGEETDQCKKEIV